MAKEKIQAFMAENKVTIESEFVPWSQSRNKGEKHRSLNWRIRLLHAGRTILETDYSAGVAHCPSYRQGRRTVDVERETETGRRIAPDACDVIASLSMNSSVLDCSSFEEWAGEFGYDVDSRKAESIYRACLEIALKLRNGLGEEGLRALQIATQDY